MGIMARNELMKIPPVGPPLSPQAPGTFLQRFLSGRAGAETGSPLPAGPRFPGLMAMSFSGRGSIPLPPFFTARKQTPQKPRWTSPPLPRTPGSALMANGEENQTSHILPQSPTFLRMLLWQVLRTRPLSSPLILRPIRFTRQVAAGTWTSAEAAGRLVLAGPVLLPPA